MRVLFLVLTILNSASVMACDCSGNSPKDFVPVIQAVITKKLGTAVTITKENLTWIKAYPTLEDKINLIDGEKGTACEVFGPNGESLSFCARKLKRDYLVKVQGCEFVVHIKSTLKRATAHMISSTCP